MTQVTEIQIRGTGEDPWRDLKKKKKEIYWTLSFQLLLRPKVLGFFLTDLPLYSITSPSANVGFAFIIFLESDYFSSLWSTPTSSLAWIFATASCPVLLLPMTFLWLKAPGMLISGLGTVCSHSLDGLSLEFPHGWSLSGLCTQKSPSQ